VRVSSVEPVLLDKACAQCGRSLMSDRGAAFRDEPCYLENARLGHVRARVGEKKGALQIRFW
jgi:hypothetical protein